MRRRSTLPWAIQALTLTTLAAIERSKTPFYTAGAVLVAWAVVSAAVGLVRKDFSRGDGTLRVYIGVTGLLVLATFTAAIATSGVLAPPPWTLANGDVSNTRVVTRSEISSANFSQLGVAWTTPLTASSIYGTFAANPVTDEPEGRRRNVRP